MANLRSGVQFGRTQPLGAVSSPVLQQRHPRFGRYEVLGLVARGGMGGVHLGTDLATGERVALKVLDADLAGNDAIVARLCAELLVSERVRHPGLLEVRAIGRTSDGIPFTVMEFLDGESLGELVAHGPIELAAVAAFGAQIASAVAALHAAGVVHCDLKPENIIVLDARGPDGWARLKVIDFGVARFVGDPPPMDGAIAGTPVCMPPEQWRGEPEPASDVYALGCLLYELATGDQPFAGTVAQLMVAHRDSRPARPSWLRQQLPVALERIILHALAKDPALRPTMVEMALALADLRTEQCAVGSHARLAIAG